MEAAGWLLRVAIVLVTQRWAESSQAVAEESEGAPVTLCWKSEEFVVSKDCYDCNQFDLKTVSQCAVTGFIEQVSCSSSRKVEYKSCRSISMEKKVFWEFMGIMMAAGAAMSVLVICRQRVLDRRAREKVRKQIESI